jgi:hypothetical protein
MATVKQFEAWFMTAIRYFASRAFPSGLTTMVCSMTTDACLGFQPIVSELLRQHVTVSEALFAARPRTEWIWLA